MFLPACQTPILTTYRTSMVFDINASSVLIGTSAMIVLSMPKKSTPATVSLLFTSLSLIHRPLSLSSILVSSVMVHCARTNHPNRTFKETATSAQCATTPTSAPVARRIQAIVITALTRLLSSRPLFVTCQSRRWARKATVSQCLLWVTRSTSLAPHL